MPRRCNAPDCMRRPIYGLLGQVGHKTVFCIDHKTPEMVDIVSRRCAADRCKKRPLYGFEGQQATFCASHRLPGQVDRKSKRCRQEGCLTVPSYAFEGDTAQYCINHRLKGMVNVVSCRCEERECMVRASFAFNWGIKPSRCAKHRLDGMIDVRTRTCRIQDCTRPCRTVEGKRLPWCAVHAVDRQEQEEHGQLGQGTTMIAEEGVSRNHSTVFRMGHPVGGGGGRGGPHLSPLLDIENYSGAPVLFLPPGMEEEEYITPPPRTKTRKDASALYTLSPNPSKLLPKQQDLTQLQLSSSSPLHSLSGEVTVGPFGAIQSSFKWMDTIHQELTMGEQLDSPLRHSDPAHMTVTTAPLPTGLGLSVLMGAAGVLEKSGGTNGNRKRRAQKSVPWAVGAHNAVLEPPNLTQEPLVVTVTEGRTFQM